MRLFTFAEVYKILRLRQDTFDRLVKNFWLVDEVVIPAYMHTNYGSPLRKLLVDGYYLHKNLLYQDIRYLRYNLRKFPQEYLIDLVVDLHQVPKSQWCENTREIEILRLPRTQE